MHFADQSVTTKRLVEFAKQGGPSRTPFPTFFLPKFFPNKIEHFHRTIFVFLCCFEIVHNQGRLLLRNTRQYIPTIYNAGKQYCFFIDVKQNTQGCCVV